MVQIKEFNDEYFLISFEILFKVLFSHTYLKNGILSNK